MSKWYASGAGAALAVVVLAACRPVSPEEASVLRNPSGTVTLTTSTSLTLTQEETMSLDELAPTPLVMQAMKDLARRLALPLEAITVELVEEVTWRDSSLGCPQPGLAARPVLQEGLRIRLATEGRVYEYHSGVRRAPFLCDRPADDSTAAAPPNLDN